MPTGTSTTSNSKTIAQRSTVFSIPAPPPNAFIARGARCLNAAPFSSTTVSNAHDTHDTSRNYWMILRTVRRGIPCSFTRRHEHVCSIRALPRFFVTRLTREIAMLCVRELGVQQPARRNLRRLCGDARSGTLDDVALAALRLDDLLGIEDGARVGSDRRPRREDAADLVGIFPTMSRLPA